MIERKFVAERLKEHQIEEFISQTLKNVGHSHTKLMRTPMGEKVVIFASRPGLVVGRKGENIKKLTNTLKKRFNLENPQIEISEVEQPNLDAQIVAERIASTLERFGINKFKAIGHKTMTDVMGAGALGIEINISGKVPSQRAKSWRFYSGYLKKCGNIATECVKRAQAVAILKTGEIGVKVAIMPPDTKLPDDIEVGRKEAPAAVAAPVAEVKEAPKEEQKEQKAKRPRKKTAPKVAEGGAQ
ncbi:30S ribosomal protein S3 [Candidatus Woesearchaeota archaeon]|nr:30S ribosomal protein S3 [Candidatus Woesearchaeota archaeon]